MGISASKEILPSKNAVLEAVKEVGRLAFFAAVAAVVGWIAQKTAGMDPNSVYYVIAITAMRFLDKYVHTSDKTELTGIAPF